jgi:hypothetical protein
MIMPPDPDNPYEMHLAFRWGEALSGARSPFVFFTLVGVTASCIAGWWFYLICRYLYDVYKVRLRQRNTYVPFFGVLLITFAVIAVPLVVGIGWGMLTIHPVRLLNAFIPFSYVFAGFTVLTVILEYLASRHDEPEAPEIEDVSLDDVVSWYDEVSTAAE